MRYHILKLDGLQFYADEPSSRYEYSVEFKIIGGGGMLYFHDVRKWLNEIYGWSDQIGNAVTNTDNEYWTWQVKSDSYQIYLKSDKELMMMKLKFPINDMV